eukprot:GDKI01046786.1.p1 GENE.GDKI01046786.1~~GDKI01046786.1.p1  ORF type:complete len:498 (+),score=124.63 GDKI01046786.1:105-1496(+)
MSQRKKGTTVGPNSGKKETQQEVNMWLNNGGVGKGLMPGREVIGPLMIMLSVPNFAIFQWWVIHKQKGDLSLALNTLQQQGFGAFLNDYPSAFDPIAWKILGVFMGFALLLTRLIPCKMFIGPPSPTGYRNKYHENGTAYYILMNVLFLAGWKAGMYEGGVLYTHMGHILSALNVFAPVFVLFLYLKGKYFPSSKDCGSNGNFVIDFYWGTELYPNVLGWDVKQFTNDRFGLTFWCLMPVSCALWQYEHYGYVAESMIISVVLQWVYLLKFFIWETGYFCSMDIQHDRAGFYICWGCLVWVPSVYTGHTQWLTEHPVRSSLPSLLLYLFLGLLFIYINYDADRQRQVFRATNGEALIWGSKPKKIEATYVDEKGTEKSSILLASGWWGVSRHFHYIPEILAALMWAPPMQCEFVFVPYFYTFFLTLLLLDRAYRDDARCRSKYGKYWEEYCRLVPYKIIPYVI